MVDNFMVSWSTRSSCKVQAAIHRTRSCAAASESCRHEWILDRLGVGSCGSSDSLSRVEHVSAAAADLLRYELLPNTFNSKLEEESTPRQLTRFLRAKKPGDLKDALEVALTVPWQ